MNFGKLLESLLKRYAKRMILQAVEMVDAGDWQYSLPAIKEKVCKEIQRQRKVPGEIRRWACAFVNEHDADDYMTWLAKLQAELA